MSGKPCLAATPYVLDQKGLKHWVLFELEFDAKAPEKEDRPAVF